MALLAKTDKKKLVKKNGMAGKWPLKKSAKGKITFIKDSYKSLSLVKKIIFPIIPVLLGVGIYFGVTKLGKSKVTYETAIATKGTLIVSTSASGTITSGNYTNITTKVSGTVKKVYVTNGDKVVKGQKLADVTLDDYASERQSDAWVAYLKAKESVNDAATSQLSTDIQMWKDRQNLLDTETKYDNMIAGAWNPDTNAEYTYNEKTILAKQYELAKSVFSADQTKYSDSTAIIVNAQTSVASAYQDYLENSASIVAPASGTVSDLALFEGLSVSANSSTNTSTGSTIVSSQTVGKINNADGQLIATVPMSETDVLNIKANQKVTITLDAYSDMTFTGKVLSVNTSGNVSSGVTSYPVTILLDPVSVAIYPNMAVTADIITNTITDAIMVPSTAITATGDVSTVQVMKDGKPTIVTVTTGASNDTNTVITSGINEGDTVVTSTITAGNSTKDDATSLFSGTATTGSRSNSSTRSAGSSGSTRVFTNFGGGFGPGGL